MTTVRGFLPSFVSIRVESGYVRALVCGSEHPQPQSVDKASESIATAIEARKVSRGEGGKNVGGSPGDTG